MLTKRIIPCLDVRLNEKGHPVVTKGHQYDVRGEDGVIRNLGEPAELARQYDQELADELIFLDITRTAHGRSPLIDIILQVSNEVFIPLTVGGGIRDLDNAKEYFDAGADKVSLSSAAVSAVQQYLDAGCKPSGTTAIEKISKAYGAQACVVSIDPRRQYVFSQKETPHRTIYTQLPGPSGEHYCWFQCSIKGGREFVDLDAITLARVVEELGSGEILLNSIDRDGTRSGFDIELIRTISESVEIPVIASSGAGKTEHFYQVLTEGKADAALAASLFHYGELPITDVKRYLMGKGIPMRM
jgi:glutamine amidotransferase/cyclase